MDTIEEKLDEIIERLDRIEKALGILGTKTRGKQFMGKITAPQYFRYRLEYEDKTGDPWTRDRSQDADRLEFIARSEPERYIQATIWEGNKPVWSNTGEQA